MTEIRMATVVTVLRRGESGRPDSFYFSIGIFVLFCSEKIHTLF